MEETTCSAALRTPFAEVAGFVSVPQLDSLVLARRCPRRNGSSAHDTRRQVHVYFYRRVSPGIQDLARNKISNGEHGSSQ